MGSKSRNPRGFSSSSGSVAARLAVVLAVLALLAASSLLSASSAVAAAYYTGGGNGVRLAMRVVGRQIVWAKVDVTKHCVDSELGSYHTIRHIEGLAGQVEVDRSGQFSWNVGVRDLTGPYREVEVEDISGRIGAKRLDARVLYHAWYRSPEGHGRCSAASVPLPPARPEAVPAVARRHPEPAGLAFYFGERSRGITSYFEVRGHRIVEAEVVAIKYCTDRQGRHHYNNEARRFQAPIRIGPLGAFRYLQAPDEIRAFEILRGTVEPTRITGSYGFSFGTPGGRCRTGSFDPGDGQTWAVPFVARRR